MSQSNPHWSDVPSSARAHPNPASTTTRPPPNTASTRPHPNPDHSDMPDSDTALVSHATANSNDTTRTAPRNAFELSRDMPTSEMMRTLPASTFDQDRTNPASEKTSLRDGTESDSLTLYEDLRGIESRLPCRCGQSAMNARKRRESVLIGARNTCQAVTGLAALIICPGIISRNVPSLPVYQQVGFKLLFVLVASAWYALVPAQLFRTNAQKKRWSIAKIMRWILHLMFIGVGCFLVWGAKYKFELGLDDKPTPFDAPFWNNGALDPVTPRPVYWSTKMVQAVVFTLIGIVVLRMLAGFLGRTFRNIFTWTMSIFGILNMWVAYAMILYMQIKARPLLATMKEDSAWVVGQVFAAEAFAWSFVLLVLLFASCRPGPKPVQDLEQYRYQQPRQTMATPRVQSSYVQTSSAPTTRSSPTTNSIQPPQRAVLRE